MPPSEPPRDARHEVEEPHRHRTQARLGIEEEFVLLDRETLAPIPVSDGMRARLSAPHDGSSDAGAPRVGGDVTAEYLTCQIETATTPVSALQDAAGQLHRFRSRIAAEAARQGAIVAPSATAFAPTGPLSVSASPHYDEVAAHLAEITREHEVNGLHVHVEIADDEERVRALGRIRGWLPLLLALTGNGPFSQGRRTGFESWRSILIRRLPASWTPPHFHDLTDYRARIDRLVALGAIGAPASLAWAVRLSDRYPTVEVRVFDVQLTVDDALFAAALARALLLDEGGTGPVIGVDELDASLWLAARHGLDAAIVDPVDGSIAPASAVVSRLIDRTRDVLAAHGDEEFVRDHLERIRRDGTGAHRQRRAHAEAGVVGLRDLYLHGMRG